MRQWIEKWKLSVYSCLCGMVFIRSIWGGCNCFEFICCFIIPATVVFIEKTSFQTLLHNTIHWNQRIFLLLCLRMHPRMLLTHSPLLSSTKWIRLHHSFKNFMKANKRLKFSSQCDYTSFSQRALILGMSAVYSINDCRLNSAFLLNSISHYAIEMVLKLQFYSYTTNTMHSLKCIAV